MKQITFRGRSKKFWCTIYCKHIGGTIWLIGLVVNKSKRASNDWFKTRPNHRARRVTNERKLKSLSELRVCFTLIQKALTVLPREAEFIIYNDFREAQALSRYVERLGFMLVYHEGFPYWALTVPKKVEALRRFGHTIY